MTDNAERSVALALHDPVDVLINITVSNLI